jgi:hypothetical protein
MELGELIQEAFLSAADAEFHLPEHMASFWQIRDS